MQQKKNINVLLGAAFLMATSAIGPGFLTQTTHFTQTLAASFGFVILISIIIDIGAQMNIWRIMAVAEKRAQDIANEVLPGLGYFLAALIVAGGLAFNIGNIAGAGFCSRANRPTFLMVGFIVLAFVLFASFTVVACPLIQLAMLCRCVLIFASFVHFFCHVLCSFLLQ